MKKTIALIAVIVSALTAVAELREWTAASGDKVTAEFVSEENGVVTLKPQSGNTVKVKIESLSATDRDYLTDFVQPSFLGIKLLSTRKEALEAVKAAGYRLSSNAKTENPNGIKQIYNQGLYPKPLCVYKGKTFTISEITLTFLYDKLLAIEIRSETSFDEDFRVAWYNAAADAIAKKYPNQKITETIKGTESVIDHKGLGFIASASVRRGLSKIDIYNVKAISEFSEKQSEHEKALRANDKSNL